MLREYLKAIADAIRSKLGTTDKINAQDFSEKVAEVYKAGQDKGMQTEYDRFWDSYQNNGSRTAYHHAFAGHGWNDETFKPKYSTNVYNATGMFTETKIVDLKGCLQRQGINLFCQSCTQANNLFYYSSVKYIGAIDLRALPIFAQTFAASSLISVDKLVLSTSGTQTFNSTFVNASNLTEIRFEGVIGRSISFSVSPLSIESMKNIISCLKDYSTENTGVYTVGFSETCWTALEADSTAPDGKTWREYVETTLGWLT